MWPARKPQVCADLGAIDKKDCKACESDLKKECKPSEQTKEGTQCYQCVDRPQECADFGLMNEKDCLRCSDKNSKKECKAADKQTKEGGPCYVCQDKPQKCRDLWFLDEKECQKCNENAKTECKSVDMTKVNSGGQKIKEGLL